MFATRVSLLQMFCDLLSPIHLTLITCDLLWRNFLRLSKCYVSESPTWLYAKTMDVNPDFGHISLSAEYDIDSITLIWNALKPTIEKAMNISPDVVVEREILHVKAILRYA